TVRETLPYALIQVGHRDVDDPDRRQPGVPAERVADPRYRIALARRMHAIILMVAHADLGRPPAHYLLIELAQRLGVRNGKVGPAHLSYLRHRPNPTLRLCRPE